MFSLLRGYENGAVWNSREHHEKTFNEVNRKIKWCYGKTTFQTAKKLEKYMRKNLGSVLQQNEKKRNLETNSILIKLFFGFCSKNFNKKVRRPGASVVVGAFEKLLYRTKFQIVSDHKALQNVSKSKKGNETFSSRLTTWVDCLLPYDLENGHAPGRTLGKADYFSRHPSSCECINESTENCSKIASQSTQTSWRKVWKQGSANQRRENARERITGK